MKRFVLFISLVVLCALFGGVIWWKHISSPVSNDNALVRLVIPKGKSASQIAQLLYQEGLIRNPLAFKFYVQLTGKADKIQAGEFQLSKNLTPEEILNELSKGPLQLWVTIPEGLRREEVVERFVSGLEMSESQSSQFRSEFLTSSEDMEGQLFPDTYLFPRDVKAAAVVGKMKSLFDDKVVDGLAGEIKESGQTMNQILTLGSIIERETKGGEERPIVAGILLNRLDIGMPLQADATVQYAISTANCKGRMLKCNWWPILTRSDLQLDSPYNTYQNQGLPPYPIANPGLSSIKAAALPGETEYLYYIHDPEGQIHYAETLDGHNENIKKYLGK